MARTVGVLVVVVVATGSAAVVHLGRVSRFNGFLVGCARKSGWNGGRLESKRRCSYAVLGFISAAAAAGIWTCFKVLGHGEGSIRVSAGWRIQVLDCVTE